MASAAHGGEYLGFFWKNKSVPFVPGPTEAAIDVTHWACRDSERGSVPIGQPIAGIQTYVLDAPLNLVPQGIAGELYLGGVGLARGYWNRAGVTAERFIAAPFGERGTRLYRTGDLVRWNAEGQLEYLGRTDHQLKIRGFRIELGELEAQLLAQPEVREAAVVGKETPRGVELVAYVSLAAGQTIDVSVLRARLSDVQPEYMLPGAIVVLESLPLNLNGKVDRKALPEPECAHTSSYDPPQGEVEEKLARMWAEVLCVESVGRHNNFFELGGHSLLLPRLLRLIHGQFGDGTITLADFFNLPQLQQQAERIAHRCGGGTVEVVELSGVAGGTPLYCFTGIYGNGTEFVEVARALRVDRPVHGFVCHTLSKDRWINRSLEALAAKHAEFIAETAKSGRCALLGWSFGGDLAYETARQLNGVVDVRFLGLVDVNDRDDALDQRQPIADPELWISTSRMRMQWSNLLGVMRPDERKAVLEYLSRVAAELPQDGPNVGTREYKMWASLRLEWMTRNNSHPHLHVPVHVWSAESTLHDRRLIPRAWSSFTEVAAHHVMAGVTHRSILEHPQFVDAVATYLRESDTANVRNPH